jgi:superfamily II DNA or RNA helicase
MVSCVTEGFQGLLLREGYSDSTAILLDDFFLPVMAHSKSYDRASGFFSSAVLTAIESALSGFLQGGGQMRLICSPRLSKEDATAILEGLADLETTISQSLSADLKLWDESVGSNAPSSLLRSLVARGAIEVKFALPRDGGGIFHDKIGLFTDHLDNQIAFTGSVNETLAGWSAYGNHEQVEVFRSWDDRDEHRVLRYRSTFDSYWHNTARALSVIPASRLPEVFTPRESDTTEEEALKALRQTRQFRTKGRQTSTTKFAPKKLFPHQEAVLKSWNECGKRGIVSFVTGGGKTKVALSAARSWLDENKPVLILLPGELLMEQWLEEIRGGEIDTSKVEIVQVGSGAKREDWIPLVKRAFDNRPGRKPNLIVATYQSARNPSFLHQVDLAQPDLLLIADEVHTIGAPESLEIMRVVAAPARLGLSATPDRYGDEAGTTAILEYFGKILEPKFTITDAIKAGRLVRYSYRIHECQLTDDEESEFQRLSKLLAQASAREDSNSDYVAKLRRDRANIVKQASNKTDLAVRTLLEVGDRQTHWLVYCNSVAHIDQVKDALSRVGIRTLAYHSKMPKDQRRAVIEHFERNGGYLLAVHCLDQGVDIPRINAALILASSTNPREYIQRRGRILRWTENKHYADLHDVVTVTSLGTVALRSDIDRAEEVASSATNFESAMITIDRLRGVVRDSIDQPIEEESEFQ